MAKITEQTCQVCDERRVIEYGTALHRRRFCLTHMPLPALRLAMMGLAGEKLRQDVQMYVDVPVWIDAERRILLSIAER